MLTAVNLASAAELRQETVLSCWECACDAALAEVAHMLLIFLSWVVHACARLACMRLLRGGVCVCGSDANEVNVWCYALGSMSLN